MNTSQPEAPRLRLDKWLWAARFFKTRTVAADAIAGGKVKVGGERVKPAREVRLGDEVAIHIGELEWRVRVSALSARRGPASEARLLYVEDEASIARRQAMLEARRMALNPASDLHGRPTKRDRRMIHRFIDER